MEMMEIYYEKFRESSGKKHTDGYFEVSPEDFQITFGICDFDLRTLQSGGVLHCYNHKTLSDYINEEQGISFQLSDFVDDGDVNFTLNIFSEDGALIEKFEINSVGMYREVKSKLVSNPRWREISFSPIDFLHLVSELEDVDSITSVQGNHICTIEFGS
jgi:hypothetical protein